MADDITDNTGTTNDVTTGSSATDTGQTDDVTEGLSDAGKKALTEERKARTAAERQAKASQRQLDDLSKRLKEYEDRDKSELDKLSERATTAEQRATTAESKLLRFEVATEKKLPPGWAARLHGSTREELEADADALLEQLGETRQRQSPDYDGGVRQTARPADMNDLIRRTAGRG